MEKKGNFENDNIRNSSIELLRIICILGIVAMHVFGEFHACIGGKKDFLVC